MLFFAVRLSLLRSNDQKSTPSSPPFSKLRMDSRLPRPGSLRLYRIKCIVSFPGRIIKHNRRRGSIQLRILTREIRRRGRRLRRPVPLKLPGYPENQAAQGGRPYRIKSSNGTLLGEGTLSLPFFRKYPESIPPRRLRSHGPVQPGQPLQQQRDILPAVAVVVPGQEADDPLNMGELLRREVREGRRRVRLQAEEVKLRHGGEERVGLIGKQAGDHIQASAGGGAEAVEVVHKQHAAAPRLQWVFPPVDQQRPPRARWAPAGGG